VEVVRHHTGGRFETKLPHSLLPGVRWTAPLLHVGGERIRVICHMDLLSRGHRAAPFLWHTAACLQNIRAF
jgi:hypothetical protein